MKEQIFIFYIPGDNSVGITSETFSIKMIFENDDFPEKEDREDLAKLLGSFFDSECHLKEDWDKILQQKRQADDKLYKDWLTDKLEEFFGDKGLEFAKKYIK